VLEDFLKQSTRPESAPGNAWLLVRSPAEGIVGPELASPIVAFQTGFENASPETLQKFVIDNAESSTEKTYPNFEGEISNESFIVLDSRSATDGTCLFYYLYKRMPEDEDGEEEDWDESRAIKTWMSWRVKFLAAWFVAAGFWHRADLMLELWSNPRDVYEDENGVTQLAYFEHDKYELPDLENRVPFGPEPEAAREETE
jgi:hypothetical protein